MTDAWTSPNHKAFVAFTVHLEQDGKPLVMLLDIVKVPKLHTGSNLVLAFIKVLKEFGISDKVRTHYREWQQNSPFHIDPRCDSRQHVQK
jgi:hypothetical protein